MKGFLARLRPSPAQPGGRTAGPDSAEQGAAASSEPFATSGEQAVDAAAGEQVREQTAIALIEEGNALEDAGRAEDAKSRYEAAVRAAPRFARAHLNLGNAWMAMGRMDAAVDAFRQAIAHAPEHAGAHYNLGNAYLRSGRVQEARAELTESVRLQPDFANARLSLGAALEETGQRVEAAAQYREAIRARPDFAEAHYNLGTVLLALGDAGGAADALRRAVDANPDLASAHVALGLACETLDRGPEAAACYERALAIDAALPIAHNNLATLQAREGKLDQAIVHYRRALELQPDYVDALGNLGNAYYEAGNDAAAVIHLERALALQPDSVPVLNNLGNILKGRRDYTRAIECYEKALRLAPGDDGLHHNLGTTLLELQRPQQAVPLLRRALELSPTHVAAHINLGNALKDLGALDDAALCYGEALTLQPDSALAFSNVLFCASHNERIDADELVAKHRAFGERFEAPLRATWKQHSNSRDPDRTLRVGFVSGDLRDHPVALFAGAVIGALAKRSGVELHAYHSHKDEDGVSERLRQHFVKWRNVHDHSDEALDAMIREDAIDILIDLSGHTAYNRLTTLARKPAPLQASWIGYPGTTGLTAVDYYLNDAYLLPLDRFAAQFTEKLVHLTASAPFESNFAATAVNALPAVTNGYLTFASFNRPSKIRPPTIELWASVLQALPDSRMLIAGMPREGHYDPLKAMLRDKGMPMERLTFAVGCEKPKYYALHHGVDICLDTFPYAGGTTANHALWMGVPTLTVAGATPAGRQGAANMLRAGLPEFVARDAADFVAKGVRWANALPELAAVRASARDRLQNTPIRRPEVIAAALDRALREMWRRWCEGLPPAHIDVSDVRSPGAAGKEAV